MTIRYKYNTHYYDIKTEEKWVMIFNTQYIFYIKGKFD